MTKETIRQVRGFHRIVVERLGALDDHFLGRNRPMGESRLLWEIGTEGAEVRSLRRRLGLDSGYVSRVLRSLEAEGLITVRASPEDPRVRRADLTKAGRAERAELDRRSAALARDILKALPEQQRRRLTTAMAEVERLLQSSMVSFAAENPASADARWCLGQYFAELDRRFEAGFDPARSLPADADDLRPPSGLLLIARLRGRAVGCGALLFHRRAPCELKRMWVAPEARGLGVGRRLLAELERRARNRGTATIRLETNRALKEAIALYRSTGYVEVEAFNEETYAHHWFEKRLK
jgi:DNA-binding MarR family transcriptional regulator/GNAT superfamily N-acetyltransferase